MAELTIEEARKIYASSDSMKSLLLTKFPKEDLEQHEGIQEEFDTVFLKLLGTCVKTVFLDEIGNPSQLPTNRMNIRNADDEWLLDIQFTGEHTHFWVRYDLVWKSLSDTFHLQNADMTRLMKNQMKLRFGLTGVTPQSSSERILTPMKLRFGLKGVTPVERMVRPGDRMNLRFGLKSATPQRLFGLDAVAQTGIFHSIAHKMKLWLGFNT